jgi:hypothetical protein
VALALGEIAERLSWIKLGSREKFSGLRATPAALAAQQLPNRPARIALPRGLARGPSTVCRNQIPAAAMMLRMKSPPSYGSSS